jgi:ankyrin repeat protein
MFNFKKITLLVSFSMFLGIFTQDSDLGLKLGLGLIEAVREEDGHTLEVTEHKVKSLLQEGANPNTQDIGYGNKTALILASDKGYTKIVETLLEHGANPNLKSNQGAALIAAAAKGYLEIVNMLLEHKADPNIKTTAQQNTSLIFAVKNGHLEVVETLLKHGADPNIPNVFGLTALTMVITDPATTDDNVLNVVVDKLLKHGADPNSRIQGPIDYTALMLAISNGYKETAKTLLENKANPNLQDKQGATALIMATIDGYVATVEELLKHGADPSIKEKTDRTALDYAKMTNQTEIASLLENAETKQDAAHHPVASSSTDE